jgi:hypothetical protein
MPGVPLSELRWRVEWVVKRPELKCEAVDRGRRLFNDAQLLGLLALEDDLVKKLPHDSKDPRPHTFHDRGFYLRQGIWVSVPDSSGFSFLVTKEIQEAAVHCLRL